MSPAWAHVGLWLVGRREQENHLFQAIISSPRQAGMEWGRGERGPPCRPREAQRTCFSRDFYILHLVTRGAAMHSALALRRDLRPGHRLVCRGACTVLHGAGIVVPSTEETALAWSDLAR